MRASRVSDETPPGMRFSVSTALMRTPSCVSLRSTVASASAISGFALPGREYVVRTQSIARERDGDVRSDVERDADVVVVHIRINERNVLNIGTALDVGTDCARGKYA